MDTDNANFFKNLPKIELHAHLNGSLSQESLIGLHKMKYGPDIEKSGFNDIGKMLQDFKSLEECFQVFKIAHDLTNTTNLLERATYLVIKDFALDNVIYLELRTTIKDSPTMTKKEYLSAVLKGIELGMQLHPSITVKLLPSIDRSHGPQAAEDTVRTVIEFLEQHSNLIKGIDMSGNPINTNFRDFLKALNLARENNLKLVIHCAEFENNTEIDDMLEFGMSRCGHGTFLTDTHLNIMKLKDIPIECCLTSNVLCKTVTSYENHHFRKLYALKFPAVICTDDFGVFNTCLSNELEIAFIRFNLKKSDILQLCLDAIKYSFANEDEKKRLEDSIKNYFSNT